MAETKIISACCRAMCLPHFHDMRDLVDEVGRLNLKPALRGVVLDREQFDAIRTAQMLVELPKSWDEWPEDAKLACPRANWECSRQEHLKHHGVEGPLYATCFVDRETGACMIYDRRPAMCSDYAMKPTAVNQGGGCHTHCAFHHEGACRPGFEVPHGC